MRIAEPRVIRFLNVTDTGGFSLRYASFSVFFSHHPNLNVVDTLLLLSMKALCVCSGGLRTDALNAVVTFSNVNSLSVETAHLVCQCLDIQIFPASEMK